MNLFNDIMVTDKLFKVIASANYHFSQCFWQHADAETKKSSNQPIRRKCSIETTIHESLSGTNDNQTERCLVSKTVDDGLPVSAFPSNF